jgi:peptidyl-prolyl cis-trans isomerase C
MTAPALRAALAALALAAGLAPAPAARADEPGAAARVNGVEIARARLERWFEARLEEQGRLVAGIRSPEAYKAMKREALEALVDRELLWQEARRRGHVVPEAEAEAAMAVFRAEFPDAARRRLALERGGFTEEGYARYVREELSIRRYLEREVTSKVKLPVADVRAYYEAHPERFAGPPAADGTPARPPPLREVREQVRAALREERSREAIAARIASLRAKAEIEILIPL